MKLSIFSYLGLFLLLLTAEAYAQEIQAITRLHREVVERKLSSNIEWLNLGHYQKNSLSKSGYTSQADDNRFFNAANGKDDPEAELLATLSAFYNTEVFGDEHAQCRFIARLNWIQNTIGLDLKELPKIECTEYSEWRKDIPDHEVTMIFPAYHLNSPSSMFGHNLLRLDPGDKQNHSEWLSIAVNFGANIDNNDNSIFFAVKGLSGGYPGYFIVTPYYKKIREYNRQENRDIWEYPLNLTPEETDKLVLHLWELKDIEFDYYFFDENCSYRLLELIEVARPEVELTDQYQLTAIPVDTVRSIKQANLIREVDYRPSQATVFENLVTNIPDVYHHWILKLAKTPEIVADDQFQQLTQSLQRSIVNAAYKYLRLQQNNNKRTPESARKSYQLLKALNSYSPTDMPPSTINATRPETGHLSKRISIKTGKYNNNRYDELGFRMSFHSLEDNATGFLQGAQINIGNIQIRSIENNDLQLQQLDLVDIFSLTPRNDFFDPLSWRVYSGLERQLTNGLERLVTHVTGGAGISYQPIDNSFTYALLRVRLEKNRGFENTVEPGLGFMLGALHHFPGQTAKLEINGDRFANDEYRYVANYTHNFVLARNHSIKLTAKREKQSDIKFSEVGVSYQYYF